MKRISLLVLSLLLMIPTLAAAAMIEQWVESFNGDGSHTDFGKKILIDADGYIYVAGATTNGDDNLDAWVAKYAPDGSLEWNEPYDGADNQNDIGENLLVDDAGNVYLVGLSYSLTESYNAMLLKYDSSGGFQWDVLYDNDDLDDAFKLIALDDAGYLYVAGYAVNVGADANYLLAKYSAAGAEQWTILNNGPTNGSDFPQGLAVDGDGNSYLNGYQEQAAGFDVAIVKYNTAGVSQWRRTIGGTGGADDFGGGLLIGASGIYASSSMNSATTNYDLGLHIVATDNSSLSSHLYNGPNSGDDYNAEYFGMLNEFAGTAAIGIAAAPDGGVYLAGVVENTSGDQNPVLVKFSATGTMAWAEIVEWSTGVDSMISSMAVDAAGNVFLTGNSYDADGFYYLTLQFSAAGDLLDEQTYRAAATGYNYATSIAVDSDGNPAVTGQCDTGGVEENNACTIKYCVGCLIGEVCYPDGTVLDGNPCQICDVEQSQTEWSDNDGVTCDDSLYCNGADTCLAGACATHAGDPCTVDQTCDETADECVPGGDDDDDDDDNDDNDDNDIADDDDDSTAANNGDDDNDEDGGCGC